MRWSFLALWLTACTAASTLPPDDLPTTSGASDATPTTSMPASEATPTTSTSTSPTSTSTVTSPTSTSPTSSSAIDFEDYPTLLNPLVEGQPAFVLLTDPVGCAIRSPGRENPAVHCDDCDVPTHAVACPKALADPVYLACGDGLVYQKADKSGCICSPHVSMAYRPPRVSACPAGG